MITVDLIDCMGSDLTVVNAARVVPEKRKIVFDEADAKLINYLARNDHWTPFAHCQATFYVKAPIPVARQLFKHTQGLVVNEVSRRYVDTPPDMFVPSKWRKRAPKVKQGSLDESIESPVKADNIFEAATRHATIAYENLLGVGVCPEQARLVLPQAMMTEWWWTGSLYAFARVCKLRLALDAQRETAEAAVEIYLQLGVVYPVSWKALLEATLPNPSEG